MFVRIVNHPSSPQARLGAWWISEEALVHENERVPGYLCKVLDVGGRLQHRFVSFKPNSVQAARQERLPKFKKRGVATIDKEHCVCGWVDKDPFVQIVHPRFYHDVTKAVREKRLKRDESRRDTGADQCTSEDVSESSACSRGKSVLLFQKNSRIYIPRVRVWGKAPQLAIGRLLTAGPVPESNYRVHGFPVWPQKRGYARPKAQKPNRSWILPFPTATFIDQVRIVGVYHSASPETEHVNIVETERPTQ